jgi:hypothetical protein
MATRFAVAILATLLLSGCLVHPTGDPPPHPQPAFEYSVSEADGATLLMIKVEAATGLADQPLRIRLDDQVIYNNGSFKGPYTASEAYKNQWANGIETGETITITNGQSLPNARIKIEIIPDDSDSFVPVGVTDMPTPTPS